MKKLSLVVPIYNVEAYLSQCLDSILTQSNVDMEVLLVNDGSTDGSKAIIDDYALKYPDLFVVVDKQNGGLGDARNCGAALAKGEYLAFLDSDDFYEPNVLAELIQTADEMNADLVNFDYYEYYSEGKKEMRSALPKDISELNDKTYLFANPCAWNKLIRRSCYETNQTMFPPRIWYEDIATTPAYVKVCNKIIYYPKPLVNYRQRADSITSKTKFSMRTLEIIEAMQLTINAFKDSQYIKEIEYLSIYQLCYISSYRFMEFKKYDELKQCLEALEKAFPDWQHNAYYQAKPFAFKLYCECLMKGHFVLTNMLIKLRG